MFGKQQADVLSKAGDGAVATVDGEKITKKGVDTYKLFLNNDILKSICLYFPDCQRMDRKV